MPLSTDIIDPFTLSEYARGFMRREDEKGPSLAQWLPNRTVQDIVVRVVQGDNGFVDAAEFRAFDAEPEIGAPVGSHQVTLTLQALGQNIPISEYHQLRMRNASDNALLNSVQTATERVTRAVSDRIELLRGTVLATGRATATKTVNGQVVNLIDDDFGRDERLTITAPQLWNDPSVSRLDALQTWVDLYRDINGVDPGAIVGSTTAIRALQRASEFQTQLINGGARNASEAEVNDHLAGSGLPTLTRYDRRVSLRGVATPVLPADRLFLLPPAGPTTNEAGAALGSTVWGTTQTSANPEWGIEDSEQPGIVAGVYRNEKPPMIAEVISDAIALPILANANLSRAVKVL